MERECRQLWNDIIRTGKDGSVSAHFVGSIVYIEKGLYQVTTPEPLLVIDGQQRLTTMSLLIEALARHLGETEPVDGFSAEKLRSYYLLNPLEKGERRYKLLLSQNDKSTLLELLDQRQLSSVYSVRVRENFDLFEKWIIELGSELPALCNGIAKLMIVDISLSRGQDNPQLIFESMNSTGRELTQADLIRNYVLMGLEQELQTRLYNQYWRPMEIAFGQQAYTTHFDSFMRHYLTLKTGDIPNISEVYEAFKTHSRSAVFTGVGIEVLLSDVLKYSQYFCAMALAAETDTELRDVFNDLRELKVDVVYPFLLEIYGDLKGNSLSKNDFLAIVRLIESYVFRRAVCNIPTNSLNKTFATFNKKIKKERYLESTKAHFLLMSSYRRFPSDDEFNREFKVRDLYNFRNCSYWLRRIENYDRKERVVVDEYTIEHIVPQNEDLRDEWKRELGDNWKEIQAKWLHTAGNLTLTGYNSEYSDRPFAEKRDMVGGFKDSPIRLNAGIGNKNAWNENTILERANEISNKAISVWGSSTLEALILDSYRKKPTLFTEYSIENHPFLKSTQLNPIFEAFRKEVMALDPGSVTEEFLARYVAYKAETNFVDIVPQSERIVLILNLDPFEINDPKGICKDVSSVGHWGNGNVSVGLAALEELPYVMGLVRQSFEKQMGNA